MTRIRPLASVFGLMLTLSACGDAQVQEGKEANDSTKQAETAAAATPAPAAKTATFDSSAWTPVDSTKPSPHFPTPAAGMEKDTLLFRTPEGKPARFAVKSGRLVFRYDGDIRGERVVLFDDYGLKERIYDKFVPHPPNRPGPIRELIGISTEQFRAQLNPGAQAALRDENLAVKQYLASDSSKTMTLPDYIFARMKAVRLPDTVIEGYQTRVITAQAQGGPTTWWIWRGITVRERGEFTQMQKHHYLVLQEMQLDIDIPDSVFAIPKSYKIDKPQMMPPQGGPPPAAGGLIRPSAPPGLPPGLPPKQ